MNPAIEPMDWTEEAQRIALVLYLKHPHLQCLEPDDVAQESFLALVKACKGYRPSSGASFDTFLSHVLYNHLTDLTASAGTVRVPRSARRKGVTMKTESLGEQEIMGSDGESSDTRLTELYAAIESLPEFERDAVKAMLCGVAEDRIMLRRRVMDKYGTGKSMLSRVQRRAIKLLKEKLS